MTFKRMVSRIKAAVLAAVMTATVFVSPAVYQFTTVTAAETTVGITLEASPSTDDDAPNKAKVLIPAGATTVTFNFETDSEDELSMGIFGLGLKSEPYWADVEESFSITPENGKASYTFDIPSEYQGQANKIGIGLWYPKKDVALTIASITHDGSDTPGPIGPPVIPVTKNPKSGSWEVIDNNDGTATIRTTLTAEVNDQNMDYLLTYNHDEESYLDEDGNDTYKEGDPINSHKFTFDDFGLEDLSELTIQSFNYTITCDRQMETFQYGGGINVEFSSPADTEFAKGKNGYWYNDQGDRDLNGGTDPETGKEYPAYKNELDALGIDYNTGYTVENAGDYVEIVWDVPKGVQPYVSKNNMDAVGIQFWYAADANPPAEEGYAAIQEVHLKSASCTYTREMKVPYTNTENIKVGKSLSGSEYDLDLSQLGLENSRSFVSAVKFNISSSTDLNKIQTGLGISVADTNPAYAPWYQPLAGLTVVKPDSNQIEILWIVPEQIRRDVYYGSSGKLQFGLWYAGDKEGAEVTSGITLDSVDVYEFITREEDLDVSPKEFEITVGEEKPLDINVPGCSFEISNDEVIAVSKDGVVTGLAPGISSVTVKTPEGQKEEITVIVNPTPTEPVTTAVTTTVTTTKATTTTKPVTTTGVTTTTDIDPRYVLYGDVNLDGEVDVSDVVALNLYLLNKKKYPLKNSTAKENADCIYDYTIEIGDSVIIMNYCAEIIEHTDLGPKKGDVLHTFWPKDD